jgi:hypothetical protein
VVVMAASEVYTLEQAEEDIAQLRGDATIKEEFQEITTLVVDGTITAAGGTSSSPTLITTDTWHSLGTLTGATINVAKYKLLSIGFVYIWIDITFGVSTGVSTLTFSNSLAAAYQPLNADADVRSPMMSLTNAAAALSRIFVGQAGGSNPGAVQMIGLAGGNYIGSYAVQFMYPVTG